MEHEFKPARTLRDAFNAVDPARPLESGDPRYVDCTAVRGNEDVVRQLFEAMTWSEDVTVQLFTGHRGCGKSTELLRLKHRLEDAGYAVIYFQADEVLDLNDIVYSDVLIAIARQVYDGLQEMDIELDPNLLDQILEWFADVVYKQKTLTEVKADLQSQFKIGLPAALSPFAQMMAKITGQLKTGSESKKQVRLRLDPQITQLIDHINLLISQGEVGLRKQGKQGLVVVIDNLDRTSFRTFPDSQRNTHDALYIEHGEQLRALKCHLVYTVPIAMFYSVQAKVLSGIFPDNAILPMIKTRHRHGQKCCEGLDILRTILGRCLDSDEIFEGNALDRLCQICGGHTRDLMILVRYACRYAQERDPKPIGIAAAEKAVERLVSEYNRSIPEEHFPLLAHVHVTKQVRNDDSHRTMLHNLSVLEYINGAPPWHDVHPIVQQLPKFQEALEHERRMVS